MGECYQILVTGEHEELSRETFIYNGKKIEWTQVPVLRFERLPLEENTIQNIVKSKIEWLVFTSPRAVRFWSEILLEQGTDFPIETQIACIGKNTADYANYDGFTPDFFPKEPGTESFLEAFKDLLSNGIKKPKVLIPMAIDGRTQIAETLREIGCSVTILPIYKTLPSEDIPKVLSQDQIRSASLFLFTSPSSVDAVIKHFNIQSLLKTGAIGSYTADYMEKKGFGKVPVLPEGNFQRVGELLC